MSSVRDGSGGTCVRDRYQLSSGHIDDSNGSGTSRVWDDLSTANRRKF